MLAQVDLEKIQNIGIPAFILRSGGRTNADVGRLISTILPYAFYGAGILLLVYLILGGFQLLLSRGDPKAVEGAKGKITNSIVGFVIVILAYFIVNILARVFNLEETSFGKIFIR